MPLPRAMKVTANKLEFRVSLKADYPNNYMPAKRRKRNSRGGKIFSIFAPKHDNNPTSSEIMMSVSGNNVLTFKTAYYPDCYPRQSVRILSTSMPMREFQEAIVDAALQGQS